MVLTFLYSRAEGALLKHADLLHRDLRTLAPRVAYWREQHPASALLCQPTFTVGDEEFCQQRGFQLAAFHAFKRGWLASEEGRQLCRHERGGKEHLAPVGGSAAAEPGTQSAGTAGAGEGGRKSVGRPKERPDDLLPALMRCVQAAPRATKAKVCGLRAADLGPSFWAG